MASIPRFVVAFATVGACMTNMRWPSKHVGRPTATNLVKYLADLEQSFLPGGANSHIGEKSPVKIVGARIIDQHTKKVVVEYTKP